MALGGLQKLSCVPLLVNLRSHRKRQVPHCFSYFTTQRKKAASTSRLPYSPANEDGHHSANKLRYMGFPVSSSGLFASWAFSSIKRENFLSFVLWTYIWSCCSLRIPDCNSLLFPNKPVFAGKITGCFKFNIYLHAQIVFVLLEYFLVLVSPGQCSWHMISSFKYSSKCFYFKEVVSD